MLDEDLTICGATEQILRTIVLGVDDDDAGGAQASSSINVVGLGMRQIREMVVAAQLVERSKESPTHTMDLSAIGVHSSHSLRDPDRGYQGIVSIC